MARIFKRKESVILICISIIVLGGLFYYFGPFSVRASGNLIKIFPVSLVAPSATIDGQEVPEASWQNPIAAFSQDLGGLATFEDFNTENSAFVQFSKTAPTEVETILLEPIETATPPQGGTILENGSPGIAFVTPPQEGVESIIKPVTSPQEGVKSILEFSGFGVGDEMKLSEIKSAQLRFSFAALEPGKKLLIEYQSDGSLPTGEAGWQNVGEVNLTQEEISNFTNGGYFLYALPVFESWEDLENLKIKFQVSGFKFQKIYLDAVWLEVECEEVSEFTEIEPLQIESPQIELSQFGGKGIVNELKGRRTLYSKTFLREDDFYRDIISIAPIHYPDENGNLEEVNPNLVSSNDPEYDYEVTRGFYKAKFKKNLNSESLAEYRFQDFTSKIQLQDLNWLNQGGERQLISQPQPVKGVVQGNRIKYSNVYGQGINVEFLYHPQYFGKYLIIDSFNSLPVQNSAGTSPYLEFNFKITPSENLDIYVDGQKWGGNEILTQEKVEFEDKETGETQFFFKKTYSVDAQGNKNPAPLFLKKQGSDILISKQIDKNWLEQAVYPVKADNETTIYIEGDNWDCYVGSKSGHVIDSSTVGITKVAGDVQDGYWAFPISSTILDSTTNTTTFTGYLSANTSVLAHNLLGLLPAGQASCPDLEANDPGGYGRTTASYSWDLTAAGTGSKTTGNIKSVFDEWKNGYSHSDGDRFGIVIDDSVTGNNQGLSFYDTQTYATSSTYLTIDYAPPNQAPTLDAVVENPTSADGQGVGSTAGNPTNEGDEITWNATSTDPEGDDWYLAICKEDSITPNSLAAPTCDGTGAWIVTAATTSSGLQHSATTSTSGVSATSSAWYAFACDHNADPKCSASSQGTGTAAENSPFCTNHRPSFTGVSNDGGKNPGETVTWSSTALETDKFLVADWIGLYICDTTSFATGSSPGCGGTTWCSATSTGNTQCGYAIPGIKQDKTYNAYAFVVDNHGFDASGATQGSADNYTVNNVAPTVTAATISFVDAAEGDTDLDLTVPEGETTGFEVRATITDKNSCEESGGGSEIATNTDATVTKSWVYRSGVGSSCSASTTDCYIDLGDCTLGPCGGATDDTVTTTCTFDMWYVADPTDSTSYFPSETWLASVKAVDDDNASSTQESSNPSEMKSYAAYSLVTNTSIDYGFVSSGATSPEGTTTVKAIGNVGLDVNISGQDMEQVGNGNTIAIDQQHFSSTTGFTWANGLTATSTPQELEIDCKKTAETSTPATSSAYWIIKIPDAQPNGTYEGTNTIAGAINNETSTWH